MKEHLVVAGGFALLAVGIALLVLPGPGIPLVIAGMTILARRYHWARRGNVWARHRWRRVVLRARTAGPKQP